MQAYEQRVAAGDQLDITWSSYERGSNIQVVLGIKADVGSFLT